jgi:ribosomal protein S27AE
VIWHRSPAIDPATLPDDLGVDWSRWSDGRAYRLKRRRDFPNVDPGLARSACELAATRMGKAARTARDIRVPTKLIWVQFADGFVKEGQPCPRCGSRKLMRLHADFMRCPECRAQLRGTMGGLDTLDEAQGESVIGPRARARFGAKLRSLENVRLERVGETAKTGIYNGYAADTGTTVVILAEFETGDGDELTTENMYDRVARVKVFPAELFGGLVDIAELEARPESDWDLVF